MAGNLNLSRAPSEIRTYQSYNNNNLSFHGKVKKTMSSVMMLRSSYLYSGNNGVQRRQKKER